jgi:chromosome segregation ATPase
LSAIAAGWIYSVSPSRLGALVVRQAVLGGFSFVMLATALAGALRAADAPNAEEDRLRAALREMTQQLRSAQTELSNLQATQASLADEKKTLSEKYETLKKQVVSDRAAADKAAADSAARAVDQKAAIARLEAALEKAKAEGEKSAQEARAAEAQDVKLTAENYALQRRAADRETKNLALFLLANEILSRYEDFSLGKALNAKEPFVGATRTKLENLVQDYQDKILDQRAK